MNINKRKSDLLEKYLNNSCTQEEFDEFINTLKDTQDNEAFDEAMQRYWASTNHQDLRHHNVNWNRISTKVKTQNNSIVKTSSYFKYAASITVVMGLLAVAFLKKATVPVKYLTQHTASAKTKSIVLSDGSKITLNANSELKYPEKFNGERREVYLKGEAYFDVVHDETKPFIIHSGKLTTHVLGTSFTVSAYSQTAPMNVTVLTGKVAVKNESTQALAVLTRGQSATTWQGNNKFLLARLATPEDAIAFTEDKIIFENANLNEVALKLSNKYGVNIKITDQALAQQHITAIFQGQNLTGILNAITKLTHAKYLQNDNIYTLYNRKKL
ncbi:FecR family protein [Mucilaginibacter lacusdianchii]|uniref:FecR family protein n=1 Tax=Mucilaginibacter lacusdianchii TaxID=2684211 RepID=UPI00131C95C6|nr:FecR domain-containing protein [Mucilaginibacter sp. JXJ CY 39]